MGYYSDWMSRLNNNYQNDSEETKRVSDLISKSNLPDYDPNFAVDAATEARNKMRELLAPYSSNPIDSSLDAGGMDTSNRLTKISQDLGDAQSMYSARGTDISRGLAHNQDIFNNNINKLKMINDMISGQKSRASNTYINEINRQAQYKNINESYSRKIEELKKQAEYERKRGNMAGWSAALAAIGTIVGTIYGGPAGGAALGYVGSQAGNAIGGY